MAKTHPNVLKIQRQKRMRRAYLKGYDMGTLIKVQRRVGTGDIPKEHLGYFDYRRRGNTFWDTYLDKQVPIMESNKRLDALWKSRLECVNQLNTLTQLVMPEMNVVIYRGGITKIIVRFYFSSDYTKCFFMKEDWNAMVIHKSGVYGSKDRAMFNWHNKSVNWYESVPIT